MQRPGRRSAGPHTTQKSRVTAVRPCTGRAEPPEAVRAEARCAASVRPLRTRFSANSNPLYIHSSPSAVPSSSQCTDPASCKKKLAAASLHKSVVSLKTIQREAAAQRLMAKTWRENSIFFAKRQDVWFEAQSVSRGKGSRRGRPPVRRPPTRPRGWPFPARRHTKRLLPPKESPARQNGTVCRRKQP